MSQPYDPQTALRASRPWGRFCFLWGGMGSMRAAGRRVGGLPLSRRAGAERPRARTPPSRDLRLDAQARVASSGAEQTGQLVAAVGTSRRPLAITRRRRE